MDPIEFLRNFLSGLRQGEALWLAYQNEQRWRHTASSAAYTLPRDETASLTFALPRLRPHLRGRRVVVDIGPGTADAVRNKTIPIIERCPNAIWYEAQDVVPSFAAQAAELTGYHFPFVGAYHRVADAFAYPTCTFGAPTLFLLLGGTAGNLPTRPSGALGFFDWLVQLFERNPDALVLASFDNDCDGERQTAAYADQAMAQSFLETAESRLGWAGFREEDFKPGYHWNAETNSIEIDIRAKRDISLTLWDGPIAIARDSVFQVGVSIKLTDEQVRGHLAAVKAQAVATFRHPQSRVSLYLIGNGTAEEATRWADTALAAVG